jgi:hypothetical protein
VKPLIIGAISLLISISSAELLKIFSAIDASKNLPYIQTKEIKYAAQTVFVKNITENTRKSACNT